MIIGNSQREPSSPVFAFVDLSNIWGGLVETARRLEFAERIREFLPALEAARQHKWRVEVVAWGATANRTLVEWVEGAGGVFVDLDDFYYSVSFVEWGRVVQPVSLLNRPLAQGRG